MALFGKTPLAFDRSSVESIPDGITGCYAIYSDNRIIYIGKGDIRDRMLRHFSGNCGNRCILAAKPTHFVYAEMSNMDAIEKVLIAQYSPPCNERVG